MPEFPGTPGPDQITGTDEDDILNGLGGSEGDDILDGRRGADRLYGGGGNDVLEGGEGDDILDGGITNESPAVTYGTIVYYGGDFASYRTATNGVTVDLRLMGAPQNTGQGADTLHNIEGLYGSDFDDQLTGDHRTNVLSGLGGADRLFGMGGNDILLGGDGDDEIDGGDGDDEIWGGAGFDIVRGGAGNDTIHIRFGGADDVDGGDGDDVIMVEDTQAASRLQGGAGRDTLLLGYGELILDAFSEVNGFEIYRGSSSNAGILGTSGDNILDFRSLTAAPDEPFAQTILRVRGGLGDDIIMGMAGDGRDHLGGDTGVSSIGGNDILYGFGGDDVLSGDGGDDRLYGGDGNDILVGGDGDDLLMGEAGDDLIHGEHGGIDDIDAGDGDDIVIVGRARMLQGGAGTDTLILANNASLTGFSAANGFELFGGMMSGMAEGSAAADVLDFSDLTAISPLVQLQFRGGDGDDVMIGINGASNTLIGDRGADLLYGGDRNDWLAGFDGDDEIHGGDGDDRIDGNDGDDRLFGGGGNDTFTGGTGDDLIDGGEGIDTLNFADFARGGVIVSLQAGESLSEGTDRLISIENVIGSRANDSLTGSDVSNRLVGGDGADTLNGLGGDDVLIGGRGSDTINGGSGVDLTTYNGLYYGYAQVLGGFNGLIIQGGFEGGTDRVSEVETVQFLDGALSFRTDTWEAVVYRMYDAAFDRGPDPFGLKTWSETLANGTNLRVLSDTFEASPEFQARYGHLNNEAFITEMYRFSLNREPDAPGLQHWLNFMDNGMSRAEVLFHFSESQEHKSVMSNRILSQGIWIQDENTIAIARLHDALLDQLPDAFSLRQLRNQMDTGTTLEQIAGILMNRQEYGDIFGGLMNQQFVEKLYTAILNRPGDAEGIATHVALLQNGMSRAELLVAFSQSIENSVAYQRTWNQQVRTLENGLYPAAAPDEDKGHDAPEVLPAQADDDDFGPEVLPGLAGDKGHAAHDAFAAEVLPGLDACLADEADAWNAHIVRSVSDVSPFEGMEGDAPVMAEVKAEVLPVIEDDGFVAEVLPGAADQPKAEIAAEVLPGPADDAAPAGFDRAGDDMLTEDAFLLSDAAPILAEVLPGETGDAAPAPALAWLHQGDTAAFDAQDSYLPLDAAHAPKPDDIFA